MLQTSHFVNDVLEGFNAFWGIVAIYLAFYFARLAMEDHNGLVGMLYSSYRRILWGKEETTWRDGALAAATLFSGEFLRCLTIWTWRHFHLKLQVPLLTVAVALTCLGGLCFLRVYTPQMASRQRTLWLIGVALTAAVVSVLID